MGEQLLFHPIITNNINIGSIDIIDGQYIINIDDGSSSLDITIDNVTKRLPLSSPLAIASANTLGGIKVGTNLSITNDGILSATNTTYSVATTSTDGLMSSTDKSKLDNIEANANNYSLPTATNSVLGGVKIGTGLNISDGVISVSSTVSTEASYCSIIDSGNYFTGTTVESALQEIGAQLAGALSSLEAI